MNHEHKIYLDDVRTPTDPTWEIARSYEEFIELVNRLGLENIHVISLDHDLGDSAMQEYFNNVDKNFELNYDNIKEKTGMDCAKWLIKQWQELNLEPCFVFSHSANPIGSANIIGLINAYLMHVGRPQYSNRSRIDHTV